MEGTALTDRAAVVRRGRRLEYFTIAWNSLEGIVALVAGCMAGSIALVGFGVDSMIEVTSGATLLWRMWADLDLQRRERNEKRALTIVGLCFLALAAYVGCESVRDLVQRRAPERSLVGIALACMSLVVMPLLSRAKRKVGNALASSAMNADAKQTEFCAYSPPFCWGAYYSTLFSDSGGLMPLQPWSWLRSLPRKGFSASEAKPPMICNEYKVLRINKLNILPPWFNSPLGGCSAYPSRL